MRFEIVPAERARELRAAFVRRFIDTSSDHYREHIAALRPCSDGLCYDGYLWDCLREGRECTMEEAAAFLAGKGEVFAMWDRFSPERLRGRRFSQYPRDTVVRTQGAALGRQIVEEWNREQDAWKMDCQVQGLWLPEDLYCFDGCFDWCAVFTHEGWDQWTNPELGGDDYIRMCLVVE